MAEAKEVELKDSDGFVLHVVDYNGWIYPRFPNYKTLLPAMKDVTARPDDILIITYPKSGTTWTRAMVNELVRGTLDGKLDLKGFLDMTRNDDLEKLESPRVLYTHITPDAIPTDFIKKQCKIIFVVRNMKDVIVSLYNHSRGAFSFNYDGTFSGYLGLILDNVVPYGSFWEHLGSWDKYFQQHPGNPVLVLRYEDMKEDCLREIKRIRDFLDLPRDDGFCQQIVETYAFENMKRRDAKESFAGKWKDNGSVFFRKGEVGNWKNWFTVAQSERVDEVYKREMQESKHTFRYDL